MSLSRCPGELAVRLNCSLIVSDVLVRIGLVCSVMRWTLLTTWMLCFTDSIMVLVSRKASTSVLPPPKPSVLSSTAISTALNTRLNLAGSMQTCCGRRVTGRVLVVC